MIDVCAIGKKDVQQELNAFAIGGSYVVEVLPNIKSKDLARFMDKLGQLGASPTLIDTDNAALYKQGDV